MGRGRESNAPPAGLRSSVGTSIKRPGAASYIPLKSAIRLNAKICVGLLLWIEKMSVMSTPSRLSWMAAVVALVLVWCLWSLEIPQTMTVCDDIFNCIPGKCLLMVG